MNSILTSILGQTDVYAGLCLDNFKEDVTGWGGLHPIFDTMIERIKPEVIIEVGTWKGESALHMAEACQKQALDTAIICIDTWLGSSEHWLHWPQELKMEHGGPMLYRQFLANVLFRKAQDIIVPFQTTSSAAARVLQARRIKADLIYIDADHHEEAVFADLQAYYPLLSERGLLFGHDYQFESVRRAVGSFSALHALKVNTVNEFWLLERA